MDGPKGAFGKVLVAAGATLLAVLGLMFSLVVLAVALTAGLALFAWFWWKTRRLRKQLRENPPASVAPPSSTDGRIIEGEATVVDAAAGWATTQRLPASPERTSPD